MRWIILLSISLTALEGHARDIPCGAVDEDVIEIDGLLDDWKDVSGLSIKDRSDIVQGSEWQGPADLGFVVRCNYDDRLLYLAIDVTDDRLVRTQKAAPAEDHIELEWGPNRSLVVYPADLKQRIPRRVRWGGNPAPRTIRVAEAFQLAGWSVEIAIPLRMVPGWSVGVAQVPATLTVADADATAPVLRKTVMSTSAHGGRGNLVLSEGEALYDAFLEQVGAKRSDVAWSTTADMGGDAGSERVLRVGKKIGIIGKDYVYIELPVTSPKDILDLRTVGLTPDGKHALVVRYREVGRRGSREVLAIWKLKGKSLERTFAAEVQKEIGPDRLVTRYKFVPRGRGHDLVLEAEAPHGFTPEGYVEATAEDMLPILLPWQPPTHARYRFRGDEYFETTW